MYLTAQRVKSSHGLSGINTFLYRHSDEDVPQMSWDKPDVALIADRYPGSLVQRKDPVLPGGNLIMSYLDVAAEDGSAEDAIAKALNDFEGELPLQEWPLKRVVGRIGIRFGMQQGLAGYEREEFRELKEHALDLLSEGTDTGCSTPLEPLNVKVVIDQTGFTFDVTDESADRVKAIHGGKWAPARVVIQRETKVEFEQIHGDVIPHIIPPLVGLNLEQVRALGGVRFIDSRSRRLLREWP